MDYNVLLEPMNVVKTTALVILTKVGVDLLIAVAFLVLMVVIAVVSLIILVRTINREG